MDEEQTDKTAVPDSAAAEAVDLSRRRFLVAATSIMGGVGLGLASIPFLSSWAPNAKVEALGAPVEVDVSKLAMGAKLTVKWRGKPVWVIRRTPEMLKALEHPDYSLRDPNSKVDQQPTYAQNYYRSIDPAYLVLVGICTHLGCSPLYRPEPGSVSPSWPGGFYCPCHGSKFDLAGRVFTGVPAPINLEVPPCEFVKKDVLVIGEHNTKPATGKV